MDRQRVAGIHGHAHTGAGDFESRDLQDLAALVAELEFLISPAFVTFVRIGGVRAGIGQDVERDRLHELDGSRYLDGRAVTGQSGRFIRNLAHLILELAHAGNTASRYRLVRGGDELDQTGLDVQRLEDWHGGHGGAVRIGDDPTPRERLIDRMWIDLTDDERDLGIHPPCAGVVDDDRTLSGNLRGQSLRGGGAGREDGNVHLGVVGGVGVFDDDLAALPRKLLAGGPRRGEEPDRSGREVPLLEDLSHGLSDHARCSDDADAHCVRSPSPGPGSAGRQVSHAGGRAGAGFRLSRVGATHQVVLSGILRFARRPPDPDHECPLAAKHLRRPFGGVLPPHMGATSLPASPATRRGRRRCGEVGRRLRPDSNRSRRRGGSSTSRSSGC